MYFSLINSHVPVPKPRILTDEARSRITTNGRHYFYTPSEAYYRMKDKIKGLSESLGELKEHFNPVV